MVRNDIELVGYKKVKSMDERAKAKIQIKLYTKYIEVSAWESMRKLCNSRWENGVQVWDITPGQLPAAMRILGGVDIPQSDIAILMDADPKAVKQAGYSKTIMPGIAEPIEVEGWKGEGGIEVEDIGRVYRVIEYRKNKETGEVYHNQHDLKKEDVAKIWDILRSKAQLRTKYDYKDMVSWINNAFGFNKKEGLDINTFVEGFNGGKNRAKYYFPYYYYPMKIFEHKGYIRYFGRGGVIVLYNGELR